MEMNKLNIMRFLLLGVFAVGLCCSQQVFAEDEEGGNNLSLPVIWVDGVAKVLRGTPGVGNETIGGDLWLLWYEADVEIVCHPIEVEEDVFVCNCEIPTPHEIPDGAVPVYPQRDPLNDWQAESLLLDPTVDPSVDVTFVDWGDNLEAKDWDYRSIIRTETILYQDISAAPMTAYEMIWLEGLGVGEIWGSTLNTYLSDEATVYTGCARLTIQEFLEGVVPYETVTLPVLDANGEPVPVLGSNGEPKTDPNGDIIYEEYETRVPRTNEDLGLDWNATKSEWEGPNMVVTHVNSVVWDATGSQDYEVYSAEINVKGKVIYGYNWNTRERSGGGDRYYRITFSMDESGNEGEIQLNTEFNTTQVLLEEDDPDGGDETNNTTGGGIAVIDYDNDLTYIDVHLLEKKGGNGNCNKHR